MNKTKNKFGVICVTIIFLTAFVFPILLPEKRWEIPINESDFSISEKNFAENSVGYLYSSNVNGSQESIKQSTYKIEIDFTIGFNPTDSISQGSLKIYLPRLQTRSSYDAEGEIPVQTASLISVNVQGGSSEITHHFDNSDDYGNAYDIYQVSLSRFDPTFVYSSEYKVTLYETSWDISDSNMGDYEIDQNYFNLTGAEYNLEVDDPELILLSNQISIGSDTPIEKAQAIYNWIAENIVYEEGEEGDDRGAKWAYDNLKGDCSEYSNLMVTLLRIQGIPARKVVGIALVDSFGNWMSEYILGSSTEYTLNLEGGEMDQDMPLHAWIEYFIPGNGFIVSDPTWADGGEYFNRIDSIHLATSIGENYGGGIEPPLGFSITEFPIILPLYGGFSKENLFLDYTMRITVVDSNYNGTDFLMYIPIGILIVVIIGVIWLMSRRKKIVPDYDYYNYDQDYYTY